tara:strand:- start:435 stop:683 length:249 start_codon:yes stop_codon:yes gene_type:complete
MKTEKDQHVKDLNKGLQLKREQEDEVKDAFDRAVDSIMFDYMYMGTEKGDDLEYMMFKHIETREYIKIPKCGVAFIKRKEIV